MPKTVIKSASEFSYWIESFINEILNDIPPPKDIYIYFK